MPARSPIPKVGITFYLDRQAAQTIDRIALQESRSRANLICILLTEALTARKEG